jgi:hypothetical protein
MILEFVDVFTKIRSKQRLLFDDNIDKLNRQTTLIIAIIIAVFIYGKNLGEKIACIEEQNKQVKFDIKYINGLCFTKDVYTLQSLFGSNRKHNSSHISFYPWLPFIALFMGLCFYVPYLIWKVFIRNNLYRHVPVDIHAVVQVLKSSDFYKLDEFNKNVKSVSDYLDKCFSVNNFANSYLDENNNQLKSTFYKHKTEPRKYKDRHSKQTNVFYIPLMFKYLFIKVMYLLLSIFIFFLASRLLELDSSSGFYKFGFHLLHRFFNSSVNEVHYLESKYFPRVVFCDLHLRADFRNVHSHQFQCALPPNVFNEKAFLVFWCWFLALIVFNTYSLIKWFFKVVFRRRIVENMLMWPYNVELDAENYLDLFVYDYLSTEGYLVLMLIKANTQDWYCRTIIQNLYKSFVSRIDVENETLKIANRHVDFEISDEQEGSERSPLKPPRGHSSEPSAPFNTLSYIDENV